jgi:antitoxin (DNA-binding transcriptional repressor) of toxin-antitoxin stability system
MNTISVQEIQRDPSAFLKRLEAGEFLVVVRDDRPVAEISPISANDGASRPYGLCAGAFSVPTDFDLSMDEVVLREFEGR